MTPSEIEDSARLPEVAYEAAQHPRLFSPSGNDEWTNEEREIRQKVSDLLSFVGDGVLPEKCPAWDIIIRARDNKVCVPYTVPVGPKKGQRSWRAYGIGKFLVRHHKLLSEMGYDKAVVSMAAERLGTAAAERLNPQPPFSVSIGLVPKGQAQDVLESIPKIHVDEEIKGLSSCMTGDDRPYSGRMLDNEGTDARLVVMRRDEDGAIMARAIVWTHALGHRRGIDRIYCRMSSADDGGSWIERMMLRWSRDQGLERLYPNCPDDWFVCAAFVPNGGSPYMDTFKYAYSKDCEHYKSNRDAPPSRITECTLYPRHQNETMWVMEHIHGTPSRICFGDLYDYRKLGSQREREGSEQYTEIAW